MIFSYFDNLALKSDFLSDIIAIEAVLIGVAIPISLQVVTWTAERYRDLEIAKMFTDEFLYRVQYILLLSNIVVAASLRFIYINNKLVVFIMMSWLILNVVIFFMFIRRVQQYVTNTDNFLIGKLRKDVQNILKD